MGCEVGVYCGRHHFLFSVVSSNRLQMFEIQDNKCCSPRIQNSCFFAFFVSHTSNMLTRILMWLLKFMIRLARRWKVEVGSSNRWWGWTGSFLAAAELTVCLVMTVQTWSVPDPCSDPQTARVIFPVQVNPSASGWRCVVQSAEPRGSFWWWMGPSLSEMGRRWRQWLLRMPEQNKPRKLSGLSSDKIRCCHVTEDVVL